MIKKVGKQVRTQRGSRIVSATVGLLGVVCLIGLSLSCLGVFGGGGDEIDFFKDSSFPSGFGESSLTLLRDQDVAGNSGNVVGGARAGVKPEVELNSLKVQEQISTIREEINNMMGTASSTSKIRHPTDSSSGSHLNFSAEKNFKEIINTSPVVLFIKSSNPASVYVRNLLSQEYEFSPEIAIVDLDKHVKGHLLQKYIQVNQLKHNGQTIPTDVPYLFINGVSVINNSLQTDIRNLHKNGQLLNRLKPLTKDNVMIVKKGMPSNS